MRRLAVTTASLLVCALALMIWLALPAAAQGAAGSSAGGSLLPPWFARVALAWVVSAATLASLYYFVVLPLASQERGKKDLAVEGLPTSPQAGAFAPIRWKNLQNEAIDYLIIGGLDGVLSVMNRATGQIAFEFEVEELHSCPISCMAVCQRTGRIAVPAGLGTEVILFRMGDIVRLKPDKRPPGTSLRQDQLGLVTALAFSATGAYLAIGSTSGSLSIYRMDQSKDTFTTRPQELQGHSDAVQALAFDPTNDTLLASGGKDHTLRLWGRRPGGELLTPDTHLDQPYRSLAFSPDGKVLTGAVAGTVEIWSLSGDSNTPAQVLRHAEVNTVSWCGARIASVSEAEGALWEPETPSGATPSPGEIVLRSKNLARRLLKHGGVYITATRNGSALLTVGHDTFKRVDNVAWELPLRGATMQPLPEVPEFELPTGPIVLTDEEEPALEFIPVSTTPHKRVRRRRPARGPMPARHKAALAATLLVALLPAYLVKGSSPEESQGTAPVATLPPKSTILDKIDFASLQTLTKNATSRLKTAEAAPKKSAHDPWLKARAAAEAVNNPSWFKKAEEENEALKLGKTTSRQALDDIAQSRLILARACSELGDDSRAVQIVKDLLSRFPQADVPGPGGSLQTIEAAVQAQLKNVYAEAVRPRKG